MSISLGLFILISRLSFGLQAESIPHRAHLRKCFEPRHSVELLNEWSQETKIIDRLITAFTLQHFWGAALVDNLRIGLVVFSMTPSFKQQDVHQANIMWNVPLSLPRGETIFTCSPGDLKGGTRANMGCLELDSACPLTRRSS